jgi:HTH-like domain
MGLARSTFYDEPEIQPIGEARLVEQIKAVCAEWPAYGYRRVTAELHGEGRIVNHKKVMRLMKENGLTVRPRRRLVATTDSDHDGPIFPNLAKNIVPTNLNQLWVADITYIAIAPASFISPRSWTPGHGELSAMRSASGSMHVWRLPPSEPPSRRADHHQGASITPIAVRSTLPKITAPSLPSTA